MIFKLTCTLFLAVTVAARSVATFESRVISAITQKKRSNQVDDENNFNWAGAIVAGNGFSGATGTFIVPKLSSSGTGSAAVGINGSACNSVLLRGGVHWDNSNSMTTYIPFIQGWDEEWQPNPVDNFTASAGDTIRATVSADSTTSGTGMLENLSTGRSYRINFTNQSATDLCQNNAEWIVGGVIGNTAINSLGNFGAITFTNASATTSAGKKGLGDATVYDILSLADRGPNVHTNCSLPSSSSVTCKWADYHTT
jgi:Peptidase A4 family